jgi:hypothetical protein
MDQGACRVRLSRLDTAVLAGALDLAPGSHQWCARPRPLRRPIDHSIPTYDRHLRSIDA